MKASWEIGAAALLGLAGVTLIAAPFAMSFYLEQEYRQQIARWSQQAGQANLQVESFERGWFASTAVTAVDLPTPNAENAADMTRVRFIHDIKHGPLAYDDALGVKPAFASVVTTLDLPAELHAPARHFFADQAPLSSNAVIGLLGDAVIDIYSPPFNKASLDGAFNVAWQGLSGRYEIETGGSALHFTGTLPALEVSDSAHQFSLQGLSAQGQYRQADNGLWLGDSVFNLLKIVFRDDSDPARPQHVTLERVSLNGTQVLEGELLRLAGGAKLDSLTTNEVKMGPGQYQAELRNLHAETFTQLQREMETLQKQGGPPEQIQQQVGLLFVGVLPEILKRSPALEVQPLQLSTAQGEVDGRLLVTFDGSGEAISPQNLPQLMQRLEIEADISVPAPLARELLVNNRYRELSGDESPQSLALSDVEMRDQARRWADQQFAKLQAQNILEKRAGHYRSSLRMRNGSIQLNGRPADQLLGMAMGAR